MGRYRKMRSTWKDAKLRAAAGITPEQERELARRRITERAGVDAKAHSRAAKNDDYQRARGPFRCTTCRTRQTLRTSIRRFDDGTPCVVDVLAAIERADATDELRDAAIAWLRSNYRHFGDIGALLLRRCERPMYVHEIVDAFTGCSAVTDTQLAPLADLAALEVIGYLADAAGIGSSGRWLSRSQKRELAMAISRFIDIVAHDRCGSVTLSTVCVRAASASGVAHDELVAAIEAAGHPVGDMIVALGSGGDIDAADLVDLVDVVTDLGAP